MPQETSLKSEQNSNTISWKKTFFEIFAVTFGVLLAFLLNEWRLTVKQNTFIEKSLVSIQDELRENYERVMTARNYHLDLYPDIQAILKDEGDMGEFQQKKFRGTRPPQIQTAAYEIGIQRAVLSDIPLNDAKKIVSAYTSLKGLEDLHRRYSSTAFTAVLDDNMGDKKFARFLSVSFMDFLYAEEETMIDISRVIERETFPRWWDIVYRDKNKYRPKIDSKQPHAKIDSAPKE
ncbi:hypothetical protein [Hellea balneolensis]|uniref:hypothetical protein n=1 Tax=Hellea balneolensis TaxID=287478 RepID=UPI0004064321|nr:hypothetical protein [Hellea balneolensis]